MQRENPQNINRVDHLFDALAEQSLSDPAEARAHMIEQGRDPDKVVKNGMALINRLKGKAQLAIAKQETIQRFELAKQKILQRLEAIDDPITYLTNLLSQRGQTALQANFRNVKSLSNAELLDMINEVELLYIFEELENSSPSEDK
jgi:hypothetical protein